jgi:hypothetical protein
MFTKFPSLPIELRLMIWGLALPGPRIVHIRQRQLKELEDKWWERVRSDIAMWRCDKPFQQDELAPWEKNDWHTKFECDYDGDDVFNDLAEVRRLDRESEEKGAIEHCCDHIGIWHNPESVEDGHTNADSQQGFEFGDGVNRPKKLWGFSTECPSPALLLACRESRDVALKYYQPAFSSLGGMSQIYFDFVRDTLFIDHETFFGEYENLPSSITKYIFPSDLAEIKELAVEGLGPYANTQYGIVDSEYGEQSSVFLFLLLDF